MNYQDMVTLVAKYADKPVRVLAFPCNEFGHQEPGSNEQIAAYVQSTWGLLNKTGFVLFVKTRANEACSGAVPQSCEPSSTVCCPINNFVYPALLQQLPGAIPWNFEKYLIDQKGNVVRKTAPNVSPLDFVADIDRLLAAGESA